MKLGDGPAIKIQDFSIVSDRRLNDFIVRVATELNIPYQYEVLPYRGTDGGVIQTTKEGIPTGVISIPTRYLHSQSEMVDYIDVLNCVKLLKTFFCFRRAPAGIAALNGDQTEYIPEKSCRRQTLYA